jgi:hypothetical protein
LGGYSAFNWKISSKKEIEKVISMRTSQKALVSFQLTKKHVSWKIYNTEIPTLSKTPIISFKLNWMESTFSDILHHCKLLKNSKFIYRHRYRRNVHNFYWRRSSLRESQQLKWIIIFNSLVFGTLWCWNKINFYERGYLAQIMSQKSHKRSGKYNLSISTSIVIFQ